MAQVGAADDLDGHMDCLPCGEFRPSQSRRNPKTAHSIRSHRHTERETSRTDSMKIGIAFISLCGTAWSDGSFSHSVNEAAHGLWITQRFAIASSNGPVLARILLAFP